MGWNINHDGDITPLDNGPKVPWWLALDEDYEDADRVMERYGEATDSGDVGPATAPEQTPGRGNGDDD